MVNIILPLECEGMSVDVHSKVGFQSEVRL